jgi:hypothetical protein
MYRSLFSTCVTFVAALVFVPVAAACINDRETVRTEQEFKSRYEMKSDSQDQRPEIKSPSDNPWRPIAMMGGGAGLLLGAVGLVTFSIRRNWTA